MDTLIAFGVAFLITLFFVSRYLKRMAPAPGAAPAASAGEMRECPRCGKSFPRSGQFCTHCGAAMALWTVHQAEVSHGAADTSGKPRPVINASLCIGCGSCVEACPEQGTLELVSGKAILAHPERCTGHAKCVTACPTSGITLAFGNARQTLRVPLVRENFETNVPGVFIVGELGGMGLIKTSINEGRLVADHICRRMREEGPPADGAPGVVVVGAGPAGLSASLTFQQHGIPYVTLEQGEVASTIRQYPRHKFLMAEPVEMPLYGNLYISDSTKEALLDVWESILANTGVQVRTNEKVESVVRDPDGGLLQVRTAHDLYSARYVVLAIGKRGTPRKLGVPGENLAKVTYRLIEAESYEGKDVAVVGGGDSAIEAALALSKHNRNRVTLIHRGGDFNRAKNRNQESLASAERDGRIRIVRQGRVAAVHPASIDVESPEFTGLLPNDFLFVMAGGESPEEFLRKIGIEIVEKSIAA